MTNDHCLFRLALQYFYIHRVEQSKCRFARFFSISFSFFQFISFHSAAHGVQSCKLLWCWHKTSRKKERRKKLANADSIATNRNSSSNEIKSTQNKKSKYNENWLCDSYFQFSNSWSNKCWIGMCEKKNKQKRIFYSWKVTIC